ncbi:hypothetical protein NUW54_g2835 [Trametes sanguinea]|uniref:Uncharacterized protein n=1 Tax=Trametes sanguinea TaxID=158606 RepID=A0ACC1Q445_9APHY|nr:hypothetical protein NUW54_g2835 [Trametes sanguinea]
MIVVRIGLASDRKIIDATTHIGSFAAVAHPHGHSDRNMPRLRVPQASYEMKDITVEITQLLESTSMNFVLDEGASAARHEVRKSRSSAGQPSQKSAPSQPSDDTSVWDQRDPRTHPQGYPAVEARASILNTLCESQSPQPAAFTALCLLRHGLSRRPARLPGFRKATRQRALHHTSFDPWVSDCQTHHSLCLGIFIKMIPFAEKYNTRVILLNRRDYPGARPYTAQELALVQPVDADIDEKARDMPWLFMRDRAVELYEWLAIAVKEGTILPVDPQTSTGGVIVAGWSFGAVWMTAFLAHVATT